MANNVTLANFCGGSNKYSDAKLIDFERSINMYAEKNEGDNKYATYHMRPLEGTRLLSSIVNALGGCRGLYLSSTGPDGVPVLYGAFGGGVYRIKNERDSEGMLKYIKIGDVVSGSSPISLTESGGEPSCLVVADGFTLQAAVLTKSDTDMVLQTVADVPEDPLTGEVVQPEYAIYAGNRVVISNKGSDYFFFTNLYGINGTDDIHAFSQSYTKYQYQKNDGSWVLMESNTYTAPTVDTYVSGTLTTDSDWFNDLNYQKAEFSADTIKAMIAVDYLMYVFGAKSYQIYSVQDNADIPFTSEGKASSNIGIKAPRSAAALGSSVYFLGAGDLGENAIFKASSSGLSRLSPSWLEREISKLNNSEDAVGFAYSKDGHSFYVLSFPTADITYTYDEATLQWHERSSKDELTDSEHMWWPGFATRAYGEIVLGTFNSGNLVCLDSDKYTEYDGRLIRKVRQSPVTIQGFMPFIINEFRLVWNTGFTKVLEDNEDGYDPRIMLQVSANGNEFSDEIWGYGGKAGLYAGFTSWSGLGLNTFAVIRISCTDPIPLVISSATMRYTKAGM